MAITCPRCGGGITGHDGATPCPHCETWLFVSAGAGIPHRMVTSVQPIARIGKAATDVLRRAGVNARISTPAIFLVPYFLQSVQGAWSGLAAARLPAPCLEKIPIYGAATSWFDATQIAAGATLIEATLSPSQLAADSGRSGPQAQITELRHVPIAHVPYDDPSGSGSVWIDAERGQVLGGTFPVRSEAMSPTRNADALLRLLTIGAVVSATSALTLPSPWGALGSIPVALVLWRWADGRPVTSRARDKELAGS